MPWDRMLAMALDAGVSVTDFWRMSPAAVLRIVRQRGRPRGKRKAEARRQGGLSACP